MTEAAKVLGVTRQAPNNLVNGKAGVPAEMAVRLSKAFGSEPEFWPRLQMNYDLAHVRRREGHINVKRFRKASQRSRRARPAIMNSVGRYYTREELVAARAEWKRQGRTVVFTNGCYDILHPGHIRLLEQARSLGDVLILALNSDAGVRRLKGPGRPLVRQRDRCTLAAALAAVDAVTLFDEDTPRELIAAVLPDILVKGADWAHWVAGREEVEAAGGRVVTLALEPGYSTTGIVDQILSRK